MPEAPWGSLLPLIMAGGMYTFLKRAEVRLLDFKDFGLATSERLKEASLQEAVARRLLAEHPVDAGLICVLPALEPCMSFEYHPGEAFVEAERNVDGPPHLRHV